VQCLDHLQIIRVGILSFPLTEKRFIGPFCDKTVYKFDSYVGAYTWLRRHTMKIDVFHAHSGSFSLDLGLKLSKWFKRPLVITIHQRFGYESADIIPNYEEYEAPFHAAKKIIVHRLSTKSVLEKWGFGNKTIFLPMLIDVKKFLRPENIPASETNKIKILFVGGLEERKDPITLLDAFFKVYKVFPTAELHIVGMGSLEKRLASLIIQLGLQNNVFLHGQQLDVRQYLWNCDIFVSTNTVDNYPSLALREAMAAGLAPIVTNVGETMSLIHDNENGLLVKPKDSLDVSEAILKLVADKKLRDRLSSQALQCSKEFDIINLSSFVNDMYGKNHA
jgi:glycosyltransferase involved in cell wall biosynthesis